MPHMYPPLSIEVRTPRLELFGATDDLLERLIPVVRAGVVGPDQMPFDDPMSLYEDSPRREWKWLGGIWAGRARGLGAREASSEAFADNDASNGVSRALGYEPNGTAWATRRGNPAPLLRWKLTRQRWALNRRHDIRLTGVEPCLPVLGLDRAPSA